MVEEKAPESLDSARPPQHSSLRELAAFFLLLGTTAFGPAGHIAMMEDELVSSRKWLSREKFLDLLGASNLIPGPSSSELAIHIGYLRAGWAGLLVAGVCFVLPAALMVGALAWVYVHFSKLPATSAILYGVKPIVIAVVLQALWGLSRAAVKSKFLALLGFISVVLGAFGLHPLLLLLLAGSGAVLVDLIAGAVSSKQRVSFALFAPFSQVTTRSASITAATMGAAAMAAPVSVISLFAVFLKIGAVVFGSGYVLLAFLRTELVVQRRWLTDSQLVDAIAIGQVTPGPVFTAATFIGYLLHGARGAIAATVGIFLPAFLLVALSGHLLPLIRESRLAGAFLDDVIVASLALMGVVTWQLARASLVDLVTVAVALTSAIALLRFRINSTWLVLAGALVGLLFHGRLAR